MKRPNGRCVSGALIECSSLAGCRHDTLVTKLMGTSTEVGCCMDQADRTVAPTFRRRDRRVKISRAVHRTLLHWSAPAACWAVIEFIEVKKSTCLPEPLRASIVWQSTTGYLNLHSSAPLKRRATFLASFAGDLLLGLGRPFVTRQS